MEECKARIDEFLGRDLSRWKGLPTGCLERDVTSWLSFLDGSGVARRGADSIEYTFRVLPHPAFLSGVSFYFDRGVLQLIETEYWSMDRGVCAATIAQVREPEQLLDLAWRDEIIPSGLRASPGKGIAIGVIPATGLIVTVTVFPPCSIQEFEARYHDTSLAREFDR
jgi:tetrahydromethanopterin S-methyltransferase subunit F